MLDLDLYYQQRGQKELYFRMHQKTLVITDLVWRWLLVSALHNEKREMRITLSNISTHIVNNILQYACGYGRGSNGENVAITCDIKKKNHKSIWTPHPSIEFTPTKRRKRVSHDYVCTASTRTHQSTEDIRHNGWTMCISLPTLVGGYHTSFCILCQE